MLFACLPSKIHVDHRLSRFGNRTVTLFDIQIVIKGLDTGLFPVCELILAFFLCSFPFWLRIAQYIIGLQCVEAVQSVLYISRVWTL